MCNVSGNRDLLELDIENCLGGNLLYPSKKLTVVLNCSPMHFPLS